MYLTFLLGFITQIYSNHVDFLLGFAASLNVGECGLLANKQLLKTMCVL